MEDNVILSYLRRMCPREDYMPVGFIKDKIITSKTFKLVKYLYDNELDIIGRIVNGWEILDIIYDKVSLVITLKSIDNSVCCRRHSA